MPSALYLMVARGHDVGARLRLDGAPCIIGRGRDANLVLLDRRVSRRHLLVHAQGEGAHLEVCEGAAPFVLNGSPTMQATLRPGDTVIIGDTALLLAHDTLTAPVAAEELLAPTDVGTLLTGLTADVRGLAGVFSLVEALDEATDLDALKEAVGAWAKRHGDADEVGFAAPGEGDPPAVRPGFSSEVVVSPEPDGSVFVNVPAHTHVPGWLSFHVPDPSRVTASLRRLLVVAGRICASRASQLSRVRTLEEDRDALRQQALGSARTFLGASPAVEKLVRMVPRLAASEVTVLLTGETGVGKSFVARLIHESGPRKSEPLRIVNCASIPENLIESELFGHERGAFTGAVAARQGVLETAGRGTVLLDEIGELPLASQAKLLRVLEERRYERIGSNAQRMLHARILTATNRDLEAMVAAGTFRSDLFFRISVVGIGVPPLREREGDLVLIAKQLLADHAPFAGRRIEGFSEAALRAIRAYAWPGNVRELRNAIEHAVVLGDGPFIEPSDFPASVHRLPPPSSSGDASGDDPFVVRLPLSLSDLERRGIEAALQATGGNRTKAAALLGVNRQTLYNKLREVPDR